MILDNLKLLKINSELQGKIEYLCNQIPDVEWSGLLIYKIIYESDKVNVHHLEAFDIIPMNKGSKTYTSFEISEPKRDSSEYEDAMIDYFMIHPEAIHQKWKIGLVHSHNTFGSFFSHTDIDELHTNCKAHDFYLSLIVNNQYEYVAKTAFYTNIYYEGNKKIYYNNENGESIHYQDQPFNNKEVMENSIVDIDMNIQTEDAIECNDSIFIESVNKIIEKADRKRFNFSNNHIQKVKYHPIEGDYDIIKQALFEDNVTTFPNDFKNINVEHLKDKLFNFNVITRQERLFLAYLADQYKNRFQNIDVNDSIIEKITDLIFELEDLVIQPPFEVDVSDFKKILQQIHLQVIKLDPTTYTNSYFQIADMFINDTAIELKYNQIQLNYLVNDVQLISLFELFDNPLMKIINYQFRNEYIDQYYAGE